MPSDMTRGRGQLPVTAAKRSLAAIRSQIFRGAKRNLRLLRWNMKRYVERNAPHLGAQVLNWVDDFLVFMIRVYAHRRGIVWGELELVFFHVAKAGGTSIKSALRPFGLHEISRVSELLRLVKKYRRVSPRLLSTGHLDPDILIRAGLVTRIHLESIHTFTIIRNPYERLFSSYRYRLQQKAIARKVTFEQFVEMALRNVENGKKLHHFGYSQIRPFSDFVGPKLWRGPRNVFRLEDIKSAESYLREILGENISIGAENVSKKAVCPEPFPLADQVYSAYFDDFTAGNYRAKS